jgi:hypothetical protein
MKKTNLIFPFGRPDINTLKQYQKNLMNNYNFSIFYNIYQYLFCDFPYLKFSLHKRNENDTTYRTYNETIRKIYEYKLLLTKFTPEINIYKYQYDESNIKNDDINMTDMDYLTLKTIIKVARRNRRIK